MVRAFLLRDASFIISRAFSSGVFFLFGAGRLALIHSQPRRAIDYYTRAMEAQKQYR